MQSKFGTHTSIAQSESAPGQKVNESLDAEWELAALDVAKHLANPEGRRSRKRFGMPLDQREALTRFARIAKLNERADFEYAFPTFLPQVFWNSWTYSPEAPRSKPIPFWRVWQRLMLDAWRADFHPDLVIQLNGILLGDSHLAELPEFGKLRCIEIQPVHDFQRAVAAMGASPWRSKFCSKCGQPFAADKPQRDYCSDACRRVVHQMALRDRWEKYGKKWRQRQRAHKVKRRRAAAS
jgi:hypothetical protein